MRTFRGGVQIDATWIADKLAGGAGTCDDVGSFAAALALPLLDAPAASAWARAHTLCTHGTSLVLIDESGSPSDGFAQVRKVPLMMVPERLFSGEFVAARPAPSLPTPEAYSRLRAAIYKDQRGAGRNSHMRWGALAGFFNRAGRELPEPVVLFRKVAWDFFGDAFLAGDYRALNDAQRQELDRLASQIISDPRHASGAVDVLSDEHVLALGLLARKLNTRLSRRFARRALRNAPRWVLELLP